MLGVLFLVGCPDRVPVDEATAPEDTSDNDRAPTSIPSAADAAIGAITLNEGVHLLDTISDRDGDGFRDLLLSDGAVLTLRAGSATEDEAIVQQYGGEFSTYYRWNLWAAPDLDGDGASDVIAGFLTYTDVLLGIFPADTETIDESAAVWTETFSEYSKFASTQFFVVDDLTGEGAPDLEIMTYSSTGSFLAREVLRPPGDDRLDWSVEGCPRAWGQTTTTELGILLTGVDDIDGDGLRDFVWAGGDLAVWSGSAVGDVESEPPLAWLTTDDAEHHVTSPLHSGDFDGDGHAEIALTRGAGVAILSGVDHDGHIEDATVATIAGIEGGQFSLADADANGRTDLLLTGDTEAGVFFAPATGALTTDDAVARWCLSDPSTAAWMGDQDGDGLEELVIEDDGVLLTLGP
ncbi:hypothetical protein LBMAG42_47930 [Deltaproteobacteria bacterium]|nr:hypothetical protein LBMAG42_47930 [Deltaproteobacteria bacterium]